MRHRYGRTRLEPATRDHLDSQQRTVADQLQTAMPGWVVLWSYGKRAFTAYPCWSAPSGLVITDSDPNRLLHAMRVAQTRPPAAAPGTAA
jgi:hypothetical protein